jgi:hypothetical protein
VILATAARQSLSHESAGFIPDEGAEQAALAAGRDEHGRTQVGLAWTSACGGQPSLGFVRLSASGVASDAEPLRIPTENPPRNLRIMYVARGFSADQPEGGWFLLWEAVASGSSRAVRFARIADRGRTLIESGVLHSGSAVHSVLFGGAESALGKALIRKRGGEARIDASERWCDDMD